MWGLIRQSLPDSLQLLKHIDYKKKVHLATLKGLEKYNDEQLKLDATELTAAAWINATVGTN